MKLTVKLVPVLVLLLLASPLILLKGCGKAANGGASGLCPDSVAPSGSVIVVPTNLGPPIIGAPSCYSGLGFKVTDSNGSPMNGICVVVTSNANIALTTTNEPSICNNVVVAPKTQIVTRTDDTGSVIVDMLTPAATVSGQTYFVEVSSGALSDIATTAAAAAI